MPYKNVKTFAIIYLYLIKSDLTGMETWKLYHVYCNYTHVCISRGCL